MEHVTSWQIVSAYSTIAGKNKYFIYLFPNPYADQQHLGLFISTKRAHGILEQSYAEINGIYYSPLLLAHHFSVVGCDEVQAFHVRRYERAFGHIRSIDVNNIKRAIKASKVLSTAFKKNNCPRATIGRYLDAG